MGTEEDEEEDPRAELIRRLLEYETVKMSAEALDAYPVRIVIFRLLRRKTRHRWAYGGNVDLSELVLAFGELLARARLSSRIKLSGATFDATAYERRVDEVKRSL